MTSKRGKRKNMAHEAEPSVLLMFLPLFINMYDLSTDPRQQGIFLFYARKKSTILLMVISFMCLSFEISLVRTIKMY